jgi:pimeloyl-ACP methyl ester carboxylesterase
MPFALNALDGSHVYFEDDGSTGTPVVVLGGFLDPVGLVRRSPIATALAALAEEFRLVFIDHRGHGRSDKPHAVAAYDMRLRVGDVVAGSTGSVSSARTSSVSRGAGGSPSGSASMPLSASSRS